MSEAGDNLILKLGVKCNEACGVTADTYRKPRVSLGVKLRVDHILYRSRISLEDVTVLFYKGLKECLNGLGSR